jgi:hypothetical protein
MKFDPIRKTRYGTYERIAIKTHKINFGEDLFHVIQRYALPVAKKDDWIILSEKVVSVCQNHVRHIDTVKAGFLAKLIVRFVKKYPKDIGYSRPEKMQVAVELAGRTRIILGIIVGGLFKLIGIRGLFWIIAGNRISEIDGFNPDAMEPYKTHAILPPKNPTELSRTLKNKSGHGISIIDGNNINVKVISAVPNTLNLSKAEIREALLDNPMGQDDEMTPIVLLRKIYE